MVWDAFTSMAVLGPSCSFSAGMASSLVAKCSTEPPLWEAPSAILAAFVQMATTKSIPSMDARAPIL